MEPVGIERRRHRVFVTRNTEYHLRDDRCVAVRDRRTGGFLLSHLALQRRVTGGVRRGAEGPALGALEVGDALWFADEGRELLTSPVVSVERPPRDVVESYP